MMKDYTAYEAPDFLQDSAFLAWMRQENEEINTFWEKWVEEHPEKEEAIQSARESYQLLTAFEKIRPQPGEYEEVWGHIEAATRQTQPRQLRLLHSFRKQWQQYAAVLVVVLVTLWIGYKQWSRMKYDQVVVQAGETIKNIVLPDSTTVVLNRHAQISYSSRNSRELQLQGEAFFKVSKSRESSGLPPFTVQAGGMKIAVLGTAFSVNSYGDSARIVLLEGKVKASANEQTTIMQPGEKLEWAHRHFVKKQVNAQLYMAWKDGEFRFNHTSLKELADLVKDTYGYNMVIKDTASLPVKYISGRVSDENEQMLWQSLSLLLNVKVDKQGKQIILIPE